MVQSFAGKARFEGWAGGDVGHSKTEEDEDAAWEDDDMMVVVVLVLLVKLDM